jgi:hypothetical protein
MIGLNYKLLNKIKINLYSGKYLDSLSLNKNHNLNYNSLLKILYNCISKKKIINNNIKHYKINLYCLLLKPFNMPFFKNSIHYSMY